MQTPSVGDLLTMRFKVVDVIQIGNAAVVIVTIANEEVIGYPLTFSFYLPGGNDASQ